MGFRASASLKFTIDTRDQDHFVPFSSLILFRIMFLKQMKVNWTTYWEKRLHRDFLSKTNRLRNFLEINLKIKPKTSDLSNIKKGFLAHSSLRAKPSSILSIFHSTACLRLKSDSTGFIVYTFHSFSFVKNLKISIFKKYFDLNLQKSINGSLRGGAARPSRESII